MQSLISGAQAEQEVAADVCSTCDGDRSVVVDTFINGRESHDEIECPDCAGDDFDDEDPRDVLSLDDGSREPDVMRSLL